ncbi:Alpha/beta hydrolase family protein [Reichenbachiella faecimaris]|uniref:Alpha/beta hydrolase family protein n=1 Tax=Reichenbachiella faecimaris TaxID=692418 RepID=A0A1W2GPQ8_REIFA|nr:prolyl oligopeptidase family serine peptidase [Reichenbachiella faecimaris]SMD38256.1 Alpha/beta hydrolase family protein [Reichenbachiella faecimaris]
MIKKEFILTSKHHERPFAIDFRYVPDGNHKPVILFVHGFKGFKDAMHFNMIADQMAEAGFVYMKINLSHNGVTPEHPQEFVDLEAFANNNFSIELDDISVAIDCIASGGLDMASAEIDLTRLYLAGHSRGGAVSILKACEDDRIKKLVTWAAVPDLERFWSDEFLVEWKEKGVQYIKNARTHQDMPLNYQMVDDFEQNSERFRIGSQLTKLKIPFLAIHGDADETVPVESLLMLKSFYPEVQVLQIAGAAHTFGGKHPWTEPNLPKHTQVLVERMMSFLKAD